MSNDWVNVSSYDRIPPGNWQVLTVPTNGNAYHLIVPKHGNVTVLGDNHLPWDKHLKYKKLSKNKLYELNQNKKGLTKITLWVPTHAVDDLKYVCNWIVDAYLDLKQCYIPYMVRNIKSNVNRNPAKKKLTENMLTDYERGE